MHTYLPVWIYYNIFKSHFKNRFIISAMRQHRLILWVVLMCTQLTVGKHTHAQRMEDCIKIAGGYYFSNQYDSALYYYTRAENQAPVQRKMYLLHQMGSSAYHLNNIDKAIQYWMACVQSPDSVENFNYYTIRRWAGEGLMDAYASKKDYATVIDWAKRTEMYFQKDQGCGTGRYEKMMQVVFKKSTAYHHLNQTDSAIYFLTPYMFSKEATLLLDSGEYQPYIDLYIHWLRQVGYTPEQLSCQLQEAVKNLQVALLPAMNVSTCKPDPWLTHVKAYTNFLGIPVMLVDFEIVLHTWGEHHPFTVPRMQEFVRSSNLYKTLVSTTGD